MKKLVSFLKSKEFLYILSAILFSCLVLIGFPLIEIGQSKPFESLSVRMGILLSVFVVASSVLLFKMLTAQRQNKKLIDEMIDQNQKEVERASEAEEEAVDSNLQIALKVLKKANLGKGNKLYDIPWYAIIGPPGSGKTSCIMQSGLEFPLEETKSGKPIKGSGGTRNLDFWFSNESVLIDTAGRYTTQDSFEQVDNAGWITFLDLLQKNRKKQPLNGLLIALSLEELSVLSPSEISQHAKTIRKRVLEVQETFEMSLPIYIILTKADMVQGFREYTSKLPQAERDQAFGFTFDYSPEILKNGTPHVASDFQKKWTQLTARLYEKLAETVYLEKNSLRKQQLLEFPKQIGSLGDTLESFFKEAFAPSRYESSFLLRGISITSSLQKGNPIDRLAHEAGVDWREFTKEQNNTNEIWESFFLKDLFKGFIFKESDLAGNSRIFKRAMNAIKIASYGLSTAAFLATLGLFITSYHFNMDLLEEAEKQLNGYLEEEVIGSLGSKQPLLVSSTLSKLNGLPRVVLGEENPPYYMGFGLSQYEKISNLIMEAYGRGLEGYFNPYLKELLEKQIMKFIKEKKSGELYQTLRIYLMLTTNPEKFQSSDIRQWFASSWRDIYPNDRFSNDRDMLGEHLRISLEPTLQLGDADENLVKAARFELNKIPLDKRVFLYFLSSYQKNDLKPFIPIDAMGLSATQVFYRKSGKSLSSGISSLFTYEGYYRLFKANLASLIDSFQKNAWVFDRAADETEQSLATKADLQKRVEIRYMDLYIKQWNSILGDLAIKPFDSYSSGIEEIEILISEDSPLSRLLSAIKKNTELTTPPSLLGQLASGAATKLGAGKKTLTEESLRALKRQPSYSVEERYQALAKLAPKGDKNTSSFLTKFKNSAITVKDILSGIDIASEKDKAAFDEMISYANKTDHPIKKLVMIAKRQPRPVGVFLMRLVESSEKLLAEKTKAYIESYWQSRPLQMCRNAIQGRYPFVKNTRNEIALGDFAEFFGANGEIQAFFQDYLQHFVSMNRRPWKFKVNLGIADSALIQFQFAEDIQNAFFSGDKGLGVEFTMKPTFLSSNSSQLLLRNGDQAFQYRHGPQSERPFSWPSSDGYDLARIQLNHSTNGAESYHEEEGAWAIFRLFDRLRMSNIGGRRYDLTFSDENMEASIQLKASSYNNPWGVLRGRQFRCKEGF